MITKKQFEQLMDTSNPVYENGVEGWLEEAGIEGDAFMYVCERLVEVLRIGLAQSAIKDMLSGEEPDPEKIIASGLEAGMGVAFLVGWLAHEKYGVGFWANSDES